MSKNDYAAGWMFPDGPVAARLSFSTQAVRQTDRSANLKPSLPMKLRTLLAALALGVLPVTAAHASSREDRVNSSVERNAGAPTGDNNRRNARTAGGRKRSGRQRHNDTGVGERGGRKGRLH